MTLGCVLRERKVSERYITTPQGDVAYADFIEAVDQISVAGSMSYVDGTLARYLLAENCVAKAGYTLVATNVAKLREMLHRARNLAMMTRPAEAA